MRIILMAVCELTPGYLPDLLLMKWNELMHDIIELPLITIKEVKVTKQYCPIQTNQMGAFWITESVQMTHFHTESVQMTHSDWITVHHVLLLFESNVKNVTHHAIYGNHINHTIFFLNHINHTI